MNYSICECGTINHITDLEKIKVEFTNRDGDHIMEDKYCKKCNNLIYVGTNYYLINHFSPDNLSYEEACMFLNKGFQISHNEVHNIPMNLNPHTKQLCDEQGEVLYESVTDTVRFIKNGWYIVNWRQIKFKEILDNTLNKNLDKTTADKIKDLLDVDWLRKY